MELKTGRVGQFFMFLGLLVLAIFFTGDQSQTPLISLFFWGLLLTGIGVGMIWRDWKPAQPSGRFRMIRQMRSRPKNVKKGKEDKK